MENRQRKLKRLKLLRDSGQPKEHFKMYKVRKTWLFAGITALFFGTGVFFGHPTVYADTATGEPTTEVSSSVSSASSESEKPTSVSVTVGSESTSGISNSNATTTTVSSTSSSASSATTEATKTVASSLASSASSSSITTDSAISSSVSNASSVAVTSSTSSQKSLVTPISSETGSDQNSTASNSQRIAKSLVRKTSARIATVVVASDATIDTGTLNGTNPAGADAATSTINTADEVTDSFETTGSASTDTNGKVTLTNGAGQNGSYVFDNQVDTTKGFTLTGSYSSSSFKGTGGGLGIIIQPVDPQDAGNNVNKTADVGIDGLTDTTFIGRDFYPDSSKGDTVWGSLTIRQTDASGNIITTPAANITVGTGQTNVIKTGEYYTLNWVPTSADATTGRVTGTLNYTTYTDSTKSTVLQTTGAVTVTLSDAVSLAAFGATGGTSSVQTAVISSFTGTRVTMPVTVHYVGQKSNALSPDDTIIVNVGSTFGVGAETDTDNNTNTSGTYAAKPIDGYTYGASSAEVTVVNTNITAGATNEITITYLANTGTQTVNYDQTGLPDGTTGEVSYTPQGVYDAVETPTLFGYTNSGDVAKLIPMATTNAPKDSLVVVQYKKTTDENGNSTNSGNPSNPGDSGSNHNSSDLGNSGITHGTDSNSDTGNSNASGNETVQNHVKNSTDSKVKLETLQNSNVKGKSKKMLHRIKL